MNLSEGILRLKNFKGSGEARVRYIPMSSNLVDFLMQKKEQARKKFRAQDKDLVFVNSLGNSVESDVLNKLIRYACADLGFSGLTPYGLRHTAFTDLVLKNESLEKIRLLAGHHSLKTTQKYLKVNTDQLKGSVEHTTSNKLVRVVSNGLWSENRPLPLETVGEAK